MDINWKLPFEVAFNLGLFAVGSTLVLLVLLFIFAVFYAVIRTAILTVKGSKPSKKVIWQIDPRKLNDK